MISSVNEKAELLKARQAEAAAVEKAAEKLTAVYGEDAAASASCLASFKCPIGFFRSRKGARVATSDVDAVGVAGGRASAVASSSLVNRLVGVRKQSCGEEAKLSEAAAAVAARVDSLKDRAEISRQRAISASQKGNKEEALRELRRAKGVEKQLATARTAQATLEKQMDLLEESVLQKELTAALKSTTSTIKLKSKGVLESAEVAIDGAQEASDEVADIAQVFEGLAPSGDVDDDELLAELDELIGVSAVAVAPATGAADHIASFPTAPTHRVADPQTAVALLSAV